MRSLLFLALPLAALLVVPACSDDLALIEIGDLQGLPIGGIFESSNSQELGESATSEEQIPEPQTIAVSGEATTESTSPDILVNGGSTLAAADTSTKAPANEKTADAEIDEDEEILLVGFDTLADFDYEVPTTEQVEKGTHKKGQIPEDVLSLDGKRIEVEGYMVPMEVEKGMVKSFVLSRSLAGCCFGDWPILNEWVDVVMEEGEGADYVPYAPVLVVGRLTVSEAVDEYGVLSIYRMVAETVEDPW